VQFEEITGIKTIVAPTPAPIKPPFTNRVKNKLEQLYK